MIKGAPEKILERCASLMVEGVEYALDDRWRDAFWRMFAEVGDAGERIVAFADKRLDPAEFPPEYSFDADELNFPLVGLRFLGAVALYDPPRPGVQRAVEKARAASVRVRSSLIFGAKIPHLSNAYLHTFAEIELRI